jgi:hypothetical protein
LNLDFNLNEVESSGANPAATAIFFKMGETLFVKADQSAVVGNASNWSFGGEWAGDGGLELHGVSSLDAVILAN